MAVTELLLEGERLVRRYEGREVLNVERLAIRAGETVAVLGPNGAGKSTLFRLLLLLERPDAGAVRVLGGDASRAPAAARRAMGAVFQRPHLFAGSVRDNVEFPLRARGVGRSDRDQPVGAALDLLRIADLAQRRVETLSGGEAQRVALARAIVARPALLFLDEPLAGLDAPAARRFRDELGRVLRVGARATLIVTHDPADAFALADRVVVLESGRVVQAGSPAELLTEPATAFVAAFGGSELLLDGIVEGTEAGTVAVRVAAGVALHAVAGAGATPGVGSRVHVAYRPEDVVLAPPSPSTLSSARNRLTLTVAALLPAGGLVRVRLDGTLQLVALVTRGSADALQLAPGRPIEAQLKASALRVFPAG